MAGSGLIWVLGLLVAMAVAGTRRSRPATRSTSSARPLIAPFTDPRFPLGTDQLGRDVLGELLHGARVSLVVGLAAAAGAIGIGHPRGHPRGLPGRPRRRDADAGHRGVPDRPDVPARARPGQRARALDVQRGRWPSPSPSWPATARLVRAEVLSLRQREYVDAARLAGLGPLEIAFREVLPGALQPVVALVGVTVGAAILVESALAFLGLSDPNQVSWGGMIANGRDAIRVAP